MPKFAPNETLDAMLELIATGTRMTVLSDQPTEFADIASLILADATLTPGDGNDFTIGEGAVSGRRVTIAQQADLEIDATGDADHIAIDDGESLLYVTTCTQQALTQGGTVTVPQWSVEIADPV